MSRRVDPDPAALDRAREAFARWRASRTHRTAPTPVPLRRAAVALLTTTRRTPLARALSIDPTALGRWAEELADGPAGRAAPLVAAVPTRFVALPQADGEPAPPSPQPELVLRWPGGAELVARGAIPHATLATLLEAFAPPGAHR